MPRDPDDIFGPDEQFPKGPIIDVTPRKTEGIDFDSDKPLIEQLLEKHKLDRTDRTPKERKGWGRFFLFVFVIALAAFLIFYFYLR
jgi:hypothetical protein